MRLPNLKVFSRHAATHSVLLSGFLSAVSGGTGLLTAKWLGASDRGVVVLGWSLSSLLLLVASLGAQNAARLVVADPTYEVEFRDFTKLAGRLIGLVALPVAAVATASLHLLTGVRDVQLLVIFASLCVAQLTGALIREALHGAGLHRWAISTDLLAAATQLIGATVLHLTGQLTVERLFALGLAGALLQILLGLAVGPARTAPSRATFTLARLLAVSLPAMGITLGQWVAWRSDRLILGTVAPTSEVGIYGTVSTLADIPWLIPAAVSAIVTRKVASEQNPGVVPHYRRLALMATAAAAVVCCAGALWLLTSFLGGEFTRGIPALLILSPAALLLASSQIDLAGSVAMGDLSAASRVCLVGAVALVLTAFPLSHLWGATGCAVASAMAYGAMAVAARRAWSLRAARSVVVAR